MPPLQHRFVISSVLLRPATSWGAAALVVALLSGCGMVRSLSGRDDAGPPGGAAASNEGASFLEAPMPPPPLRVEPQPAPPGAAFFWIPGHWRWDSIEFVWAPGRWEAARPGQRWEPAQWVVAGPNWRYVEGRWRRE